MILSFLQPFEQCFNMHLTLKLKCDWKTNQTFQGQWEICYVIDADFPALSISTKPWKAFGNWHCNGALQHIYSASWAFVNWCRLWWVRNGWEGNMLQLSMDLLDKPNNPQTVVKMSQIVYLAPKIWITYSTSLLDPSWPIIWHWSHLSLSAILCFRARKPV